MGVDPSIDVWVFLASCCAPTVPHIRGTGGPLRQTIGMKDDPSNLRVAGT